jgi:DNA-binding response OmpR family regulator
VVNKILLVDDDQDLCEILKLFLFQDGFECFCVNSVESAIDYLDLVDLIIVDSFDKGKEFELARISQIKKIPCIYHTGRVDITDEEYSRFDKVVLKPGFNYLIRFINELKKGEYCG